jgi:hypothetical protein
MSLRGKRDPRRGSQKRGSKDLPSLSIPPTDTPKKELSPLETPFWRKQFRVWFKSSVMGDGFQTKLFQNTKSPNGISKSMGSVSQSTPTDVPFPEVRFH